MGELTSEQRAELQRRGAVIPHFGKSLNEVNKYGYRCKHCGRIGLEFVGDSFDNGAGVLVDKPPLSLRIENIPWVQPKLRLDQVTRAQPKCQCCLAILPTWNGYPIEKHCVEIALYESSRDKAYEAIRKSKTNKSVATHNADGTAISMSDNYDANDDSLLAQSRTPEAVAEVNNLAANMDLTGFLAKGPSGTGGKTRAR